MGALTITPVERHVLGDLRVVTANITFSSSYATSGDTGLTTTALGLDFIYLVQFDQPAGYSLAYNYSTGTVLAYRSSAFTVTSHGTHQHDITTVAAGGGGAAMTEPAAAGPLETAGGGQANT